MKTYSSMISMALIALSVLSTSAMAQTIECERPITLEAGETVVLEEDLLCRRSGQAIIRLEGRGTFDMAEHTIQCDANRVDGIVVTGNDITVRNGIVKDCDNGLIVSGQGHTIENMVLKNDKTGFSNSASNSSYRDNTVVDSTREGIRNTGDDNTFTRNTLAYDGGSGITNQSGDDNTFTENRAVCRSNSGGIGFSLNGDRLNVVGNMAAGCGQAGFSFAGNDSDYTANLSLGNRFKGFILSSSASRFRDNTVSGSPLEGIENKGSDNTLSGNRSVVNGIGIENESSAADTLTEKNVSLGNKVQQVSTQTDIAEKNANCGTNTWKDNTFNTTNEPGCVN